jgi:predicted nucleic acid-binding protein
MYIDTSCLAAYYLPETKSDAVQNVIQQSNRVILSYITEVELLSAIKKRQRIGDLSDADGIKAWNIFKEHRKSGLFDVAELNVAVFKSAELMMETTSFALRSLDAIHLGIAHHFGFGLYTFDQTMIKTAREFNIKTI